MMNKFSIRMCILLHLKRQHIDVNILRPIVILNSRNIIVCHISELSKYIFDVKLVNCNLYQRCWFSVVGLLQ